METVEEKTKEELTQEIYEKTSYIQRVLREKTRPKKPKWGSPPDKGLIRDILSIKYEVNGAPGAIVYIIVEDIPRMLKVLRNEPKTKNVRENGRITFMGIPVVLVHYYFTPNLDISPDAMPYKLNINLTKFPQCEDDMGEMQEYGDHPSLIWHGLDQKTQNRWSCMGGPEPVT